MKDDQGKSTERAKPEATPATKHKGATKAARKPTDQPAEPAQGSQAAASETPSQGDAAPAHEARTAAADTAGGEQEKAAEASAGPEAATTQREEDVTMSEQAVRKQAEPTAEAGQTKTEPYEDLTELGRGNVEAAMQSAQALARGYEALGSVWMNFAKASFEDGIATSRALLGCQSFEQAVDIQSSYIKGMVDRCLSENSKLSDLSLKVASEALQPVNARLSATLEAVARPLSR